jgi:dipeptidase
MKKITLISAMLLLAYADAADACTSYLVTKGATKDGSTMISYAADSHVRYGELYFRPAKDYPSGSMITLYDRGSLKPLGQIPQVSHTYSVVGMMNEFQVSIGESTFGGRHELDDTSAKIDYGSLMFLALQRAKSAREAIKVMVELVNEYGYYGAGESFSIGDPNEAWILEMTGKGTSWSFDKKSKKNINQNKGALWVAIKIPDGYICAHANQARITTFPLENGKNSISFKNINRIFDPEIEVVYANDVISFAKGKGWYSGNDADFSFSDTYAPVDFGAARFSEFRVWAMFNAASDGMDKYLDYVTGKNLKNRMPLYVKANKKLTPRDLMTFKRNHLEGTEFDMSKDIGAGPFSLPYRWRPMTWKYQGKEYFHERTTATQQTGFSFIAQMRSWLPNHIGGISWFGVDDAASCVYVPFYCGMTRIPESWAEGNGDMLTYSPTSAFWTFNKVANFAYSRYNVIIEDVKKLQKKMEDSFELYARATDAAAMELYKTNPDDAREYVTNFSVDLGNNTVKRWNEFSSWLLVKYIDGNIKKEKDGVFVRNPYGFPVSPTQPELPDFWKKAIIDQTGSKFEAVK